MNESQLRGYITQIINEELEDEGLKNYLGSVGKAFGNSARDYVNGLHQTGKNGSAAADMKKFGDQLKSISKNYASQLTNDDRYWLDWAAEVLYRLYHALSDGTINAR